MNNNDYCPGSNKPGVNYVREFAMGQGKMTCESCGKRLNTTRDGRELRKHKAGTK